MMTESQLQQSTTRTIREDHVSRLEFNVMAGRPVTEELRVHEYRIGERYGEAVFDRDYRSSMEASPSHLIFLSALTHTQKLLYMVLCEQFGFDYAADGPEHLKIWPTKVNVRMPELVAEERDLVQQLWLKELKQFGERTYRATIETRIGSMVIESTVPVFLRGDGPGERQVG